jgi:hypothetical protein
MTNSTVNFNNITYTVGTNTIIVGDIEVNTPAPGAIDIKPIGPQVTTHLILSKNDDIMFKTILQTSPVRNFEITIYDQHSHVSCCYVASRKDNSSGNVKITECKDILSNIDFPKIVTGQLYLVISHYDGLDQLSIPQSKRDLVTQDIELLKQKVDTSKIILFISEEISKEIESLGISLTDSFQTVYAPPSGRLIQFLVEYLVGKSISGSKPSFQGMFKFDSIYDDFAPDDINVVIARSVRYDSTNPGVVSTIRRNGRIQINSDSKTSRSRFFIMLKHPENAELKVCEETTGTEFGITYRSTENLPDLTDDHFITIVEALTFLEKLNSKKDNVSITKFISDNLSAAGKYLFASPLNDFEELDSKSELSSIIIEYACILRNQIYQILLNNASMVNYRRAPPNKKRVIFNEGELRTTAAGIHPLYNNHPADMARQYTHFASEDIPSRPVMQSAPSSFSKSEP